MRPPKFKFAESYELRVKEPSGLAYIPELDRFVAIDDSSRTLVLFELTKHKLKAAHLDSRPHKKDKVSDFEGVTYDSERRRLITVSERSRRIRTFRLLAKRPTSKPSGLEQIGEARLPKLGDNPNKGIEGLAFLPGRFAPDNRSPGKLDLAKVQRFDIEERDTGKIKQPEGIVFDNDGDLYLTSEGSCRVYRYKRC